MSTPRRTLGKRKRQRTDSGTVTSAAGRASVKRLVWNIDSQPMPALNAVRPQDNVVHRFTQTADGGTWLTSSASVPVFQGTNFTLSGMPNASTYTALFDQYKIEMIEAWIYAAASNNGGHTGTLYTAVDYDSSAAPASIAVIQDYSTVITSPIATTGHYHRFVPHIAVAAYSGTFVSYRNETAPWIDTVSNTVQHYGLIGATTINSDAMVVAAIYRYHLAFRNVN